MDPILVPVLIVFIVVGLPIMGAFMIALAKILKSDGKNSGGGLSETEETRLVQDIHRSLNKLEARIDTLEAVILDRADRMKNKL
ncbi:MAG: hypothetical protein JJU00_06020 [Opitutales bacterium]|nr:hypothetical protein [Opitutales bacterium]